MASSNSSTTGGGGAASGGSNVASSSDSSGSVQQPYKVWYDPEQPPTPFKSRCQQQLDVVLAHPKLKAMLERIARVQQVCGLSRSLALSCATQANGLLYKQSRGSPGKSKARAFFTAPPAKVSICEEHFRDNVDELREAVQHELTHAYDHLVDKLDMCTCEGLACSEVRAAKIAECAGEPSIFGWDQFKRTCTMRVATRATKVSFPDNGRACVQRVFERCFKAKSPYHPKAKVTPGGAIGVLRPGFATDAASATTTDPTTTTTTSTNTTSSSTTTSSSIHMSSNSSITASISSSRSSSNSGISSTRRGSPSDSSVLVKQAGLPGGPFTTR